MHRYAILVALLYLSLPASCQTHPDQDSDSQGPAAQDDAPVEVLWQVQFGTAVGEDTTGAAVDVDGNIYVTGRTSGSLAGERIGNVDGYVVKYSSEGALLWQRQFGAADYVGPYDIAVDSDGNCFVVGNTNGDLTGTASDGDEVFIVKYDNEGTRMWTQQLGTDETDFGADVAVDSEGNCYIVGYTRGDLAKEDTVKTDVFLAKYSGDGQQMWIRQFGADGASDVGNAIAVDHTGLVYLGGATTGNIGGENDGGYDDAFLILCDNDGEELVADQFGTPLAETVTDIAVDGEGNCYVSAMYHGDGRPNSLFEIHLARYGSQGQREWLTRAPAAHGGVPYGLATDDEGNVYVVATVRDGTDRKSSDEELDVVVMKYDSAGRMLWSHLLATQRQDMPSAIAVGADGRCYVVGWTRGALAGENLGEADVFVIVFSPPADATGEDSSQEEPADGNGNDEGE